ncbi:hypothetical protein MOUN0_G01442 [Monosporozyma unispora]
MYRSLLAKNSKLIPTKGLILQRSVIPVSAQMLFHTTSYIRNTNKLNENKINSSNKGFKQEKQKPFESEPNLNNNNGKNAKILSLVAFCGALYFVSPYKLSLNKKEMIQEVPEKREDEPVVEPVITEEPSQDESGETSEQEISESVDKELKALEEVDTEKFAEKEEEVNQEGAYNEETGEINWDCPCLGGMADGPCGEEFKEAFACFVYSEADPKGIDCVEKFQNMQNCFRKYPEHYADQLKDEQEVSEEIIKENEQKGVAGEGNVVDISLEDVPEVNGEEAIEISPEPTPDISKEEPVFVEDVPETKPEPTENDTSDAMEEVELTENS